MNFFPKNTKRLVYRPEEISTLEDWRIAGEDIDQLEDAITKLSQYPVATQALLAALEERHNTREVALQKLVTKRG